MRRQVLEIERNPLTLSFLDVMSCGLCGMLMLFFIFSVLPQGGMLSASAASISGFDSQESLAGIRSSNSLVVSQRFPLNVSVEADDPSKPNENVRINSSEVRWDLPVNATIDSQSHSDMPFRAHVFSSSGLQRGSTASFWIRDSIFLKTQSLTFRIDLVGAGDSSKLTMTIPQRLLETFERDGSFIQVFQIDPGNKDAPIVPGGTSEEMEAKE